MQCVPILMECMSSLMGSTLYLMECVPNSKECTPYLMAHPSLRITFHGGHKTEQWTYNTHLKKQNELSHRASSP